MLLTEIVLPRLFFVYLFIGKFVLSYISMVRLVM